MAQDLKILTWNVFMIPKPINFSKQKERTRLITETLKKTDYDIIFFQEAFVKGFRKHLGEELKQTYPHQEHLRKSTRLLHFLNSGLFVVSKVPFEVLDWHYFTTCTHSDCLSSKGVLLLEFRHGEKRFQTALTHMQAWDDRRAMEVRSHQLDEVKSLFETYQKAGVPQLLIGDLNVDGLSDVEYPGALKKMGMSSMPLEGELQTTNGYHVECYKTPGDTKVQQWLDHIWIKDGGTETKVHSKKVQSFSATFESGMVCPLSDHHGVEAILSL